MTTAMQIGETARDRAEFCRCFKTGAAVFLHDDGIVAHSTYRNTLRAAYMPARTNCDTRGCKPFGIGDYWSLPSSVPRLHKRDSWRRNGIQAGKLVYSRETKMPHSEPSTAETDKQVPV